MNKILQLVLALMVTLSLSAQTTITNGSFESWTGSGSTIEPTQWNSNKTGGGQATNGPQTCFQESTNPHSGTYCARVKTGLAFGIVVVNGSLATGRIEAPSTNKSEGYIRTWAGNPDFGMTFTGRPDSLVFWYRYDSYSSDYPRVEARLHVGYAYAPEAPVNGNHPDSTQNIIARAAWTNVPNSDVTNWTRVSMPFTYVDNRTPEYILITTTSSGNQTGGSNNTTLWLDDFEAIYNPAVATGTVSPLGYFVSASQGANLSVPYTLTGTFTAGNTVTAELSDASGSFANPVVIGSATSTTSGTVNATIPAGTATGTGYRIRVKTSTPALTATDNGTDIIITLAANSISPSAAETLGANIDGTTINVTETPTAVAREWKFTTTSGSNYQSFVPAQTGTGYVPNFANAGTYYVVCVSTYPGGLTVVSNEAPFTIVANSIAPTASQSILVGVNGTALTVTETPAGTSREWMYATVSGGLLNAIAPAQTGTTYTPNFNAAGNYYVVCKSTINNLDVYSNEVLISVGSATITTGSVSGSPFQFSPSAPDAQVTVPYTTSGTFNNGNVFTAQLSDAAGSFASPVNIGTVTATGSGTITASVPHTTPAGNGYRIRVVSDNPVVLGGDNGADLVVDQFSNSVAPPDDQAIALNTNGTALAVFASQTTTQDEWKYATVSGGPYTSFSPAQTGSSYTPNFATPGTFFVVAVSTNTYGDNVTSNEVRIDVANGTTITTSAISGSPFDISPNLNAPVTVNFTSDAVFNAGNVFTAQLSDFTGSFANPVNIGTLNGATIGAISATIPGATPGGTNYRIRVVSTDPAITGSDNGTDLVLNPFTSSIAPTDTQYIARNADGNAITVTESQTATRTWKYSEVSGLGYTGFNPAQTGTSLTPRFALASTYYVVCESKNTANDAITTQEVVIVVTNSTVGINEAANEYVKAYWNGNNFIVDLSASKLSSPVVEVANTNGQVLVKETLNAASLNTIATNLASGVYFFKITDGGNSYSGKTVKQ